MVIGSCEIELIIFEVNSLKEKRHVIKSLIKRIQSRFNVSIAEVDLNDIWRRGVIGFACVTTSTKHANQIINNVVKFIENDGRVEIINCEFDIL
ncbi:DUF503 domain-containing protein [Paramaledivibacter caminithermalis]|jgi:uncharacterized protein YlxP (DUF503 family)|uniref:DUF503 domain-containing protein n=1 Tax=Paramaledivibacter caminithermalis (strain DSM 15212 / CIP 107654 / DViRD3) TaxID=1121301 RepID=A0A1M6MM56_PARC5|nr:DUF503 domain-containing protein [Paramaledivibacter caminithermalis]SHJ84575.1 hypothetical protein SAMN02745912_01316 [Paramaledivibacter caminithermalis DSM 15212]